MGLTKSEFAKRLGVSRQIVYRALERGRVTAEADGTIDWVRGVAQWQANTDSAKRTHGGPAEPAGGASPADPGKQSATGTYTAARAGRERVETRLKLIRLQQLTGELVSVAEVKLAAYKHARSARDLLVAMPDRLATLCAAEADPVKVHVLISEEVTRICEELWRPVQAPADGASERSG